MQEFKFENYISLGPACSLAASMGKYGLRSWSGVFDWLVTGSFQWVLHYMENDFEGFLEKENLEMIQANPRKFRDKSNGFVFLHDQFLFQEEYEKIRDKYQKKIGKFLDETARNSCFLRAVLSAEEIDYIKHNSEYIKRVIKKKNANNQIVFLIKEGMEVCDFPFQYFVIKGIWGAESRYMLRAWLDGADDFLSFCAGRFDAVNMMKNIAFDQRTEEQAYKVTGQRYNLLIKLLEADWENILLPEKMIIYGAGNIGKQFCKMAKEKCEVLSFVDKNKAGTLVEGIPVIDVAEIEPNGGIPYIVTATYDFQSICNEIRMYDSNAEIISLDNVLDKKH